MNLTSQILIGVALLSCAAVCGSEVFGMLVIRPALEEDNEALTALKRRTHEYCEPRLRLLWAFEFLAAILATAATILADRSAAAVAMIVAVLMFVIWLAVDLRLGATTPVQGGLSTSASPVPSLRMRRQDDLMIRTSLQTVALCALCAAALPGPS